MIRTYPRTLAPRASTSDAVLAVASRPALFAAFQGLAAVALAVQGHAAPWSGSIAWWPVTIVGANVAGLFLLRTMLHRDGRRYRDLLRVNRADAAGDLVRVAGLLPLAAAFAAVPNLVLATWLWGDPATPMAVFVQPLPLWAASVAAVAFPVTIALVEMPTYYGYVRPVLERIGCAPWRAVAVAGAGHGLQHAVLPLVLDPRFLIWRAAMFLPFAWFVAAALRRRPRLLPYLVAAHGLLDASVALSTLRASLA